MVPSTVFVLTWGGGDEPESPSVGVHLSKAGALAGARRDMEGLVDDIDRVLQELEKDGHADSVGASDSFMRLEELPLEP